jgi:hypothetical protein
MTMPNGQQVQCPICKTYLTSYLNGPTHHACITQPDPIYSVAGAINTGTIYRCGKCTALVEFTATIQHTEEHRARDQQALAFFNVQIALARLVDQFALYRNRTDDRLAEMDAANDRGEVFT